VALLAVHDVTRHDPLLIAVTAGWTLLPLAVFTGGEDWQRRPAAWLVDGVAAIAPVRLSGDWRSPFYLRARGLVDRRHRRRRRAARAAARRLARPAHDAGARGG
jgi:hypothetical protein